MALNYKLIGKKLKAEREKKGYTQEDLAEIIDVSVPYLSRIENGKTNISLKRLDQLCGIFEVSFASILDDSSYSSKLYLNDELGNKLKDCSPEKKDKIYQIVNIILED